MKRIGMTVFGIVLAAATLTGCATSGNTDEARQNDNEIGGVRTSYVELPDGRTVLCVSNKQGYAGGLSCDWESIAPAE
jgi:hypothetical protein